MKLFFKFSSVVAILVMITYGCGRETSNEVVVYVSEDRVESLDMAPIDAVKNIRVLGRGSAKIASSGL